MVPATSGIASLKDLDGKPIASRAHHTELTLADRMREQGNRLTTPAAEIPDRRSSTYGRYLGKRCGGRHQRPLQLRAKRNGFPTPLQHVLPPVVMSKEPLTPASINGDPAWADAIRFGRSTPSSS